MKGEVDKMRNHALLRLLLSAFFLYIAWPKIPEATSGAGLLFWGMWLVFFMICAGANLAILLQLQPKLEVEQSKQRKRLTDSH